MIKNKFRSLVVCSVLILAVVLITFTHNAQNQTPQDDKTMSKAEKKQKERSEMFGKTSSTDIPVDEGNSIKAVRRIVLIYDGNGKKNRDDLVEIELYSKYTVPISNARSEYVLIGDKVFTESSVITNGHKLFVRITPSEFNDLSDNALIRVILEIPIFEQLKKDTEGAYKKGEPKTVKGAKFGRINKKMIDQFPTIEEDGESFIKRITDPNDR